MGGAQHDDGDGSPESDLDAMDAGDAALVAIRAIGERLELVEPFADRTDGDERRVAGVHRVEVGLRRAVTVVVLLSLIHI